MVGSTSGRGRCAAAAVGGLSTLLVGGTSGRGRCAAAVVVGLSTSLVGAPDAREQADRRDHGVRVVAEQAMSGLEIDLRVETLGGRTLRGGGLASSEVLRIGERVQICFRVSRPGYVSLWSQDGGARPQQIYPNRLTSESGLVDDNERCAGARGDGYNFQVEGPPGDSLVFLHYSPNETEQIRQEDFPVIRRVRSSSPAPYASSSVAFRIVE